MTHRDTDESSPPPAKLNARRRLKARVRARMEQTGESYQAALQALRRERGETPAAQPETR